MVRLKSTVDKNGEAEEVQVLLPTTGVPANVRVSLGQQHRAALESTSCQILDHLERYQA